VADAGHLDISMTYTFDEFIRHWKDYGVVRNYTHLDRNGEQVEIGDSHDYELSVLRVFDYMRQIYSDKDEAREKGMLFSLMYSYLDEHAADFDVGTLSVTGKTMGLVGEHLLRAVHHVFTTVPLADLGHGPAPADIIKLAESYEKDYPAA
jgi:hypothetical protein